MSATSFNPLAVARDLEAAGIEVGHAEAMRTAATADHDALATKGDIAAVRAEVATVRAEVATLRSEVRWMFGFQAALILAIGARLFGLV